MAKWAIEGGENEEIKLSKFIIENEKKDAMPCLKD